MNLVTLTWTLISDKDGPLARDKSKLVGYHDYLYFYGGYGKCPAENQYVKAKYDLDPDSTYQEPKVWYGDLWRFHLKDKKWEFLKNGPSPRCGFAADKMDQYWIIFGGNGADGRLNDVYFYDFESNIWTCLNTGFKPSSLYFVERNHEELGLVRKGILSQKA